MADTRQAARIPSVGSTRYRGGSDAPSSSGVRECHCRAGRPVVSFGGHGAGNRIIQSAAVRTAWDEPDLRGIWDFRTITPLERPDDLADQAFLTEEEAANLEQEVVDRNVRLSERAAERTTAADQVDRREDGTPGFYNNFWLDRGTRAVGTRRTSLIIDPPNGQIPALTPSGQQRADGESGEDRREHPADSWLDRSTSDRCLLGFNAGPPLNPGGYNQNLQIFQTPDHVVLLTEMVHTVRVVPLDGRPPLGDPIPQWSGDARGHWEGDTSSSRPPTSTTREGGGIWQTKRLTEEEAASTWSRSWSTGTYALGASRRAIRRRPTRRRGRVGRTERPAFTTTSGWTGARGPIGTRRMSLHRSAERADPRPDGIQAVSSAPTGVRAYRPRAPR